MSMITTSLTHQFISFPIQHVQNFLVQVSGDRLARALFQLAICGGSLAVPQDLVQKDKTSKTTEQSKKEDKPSTTSLPSEGINAGRTVSLETISAYLMPSNNVSVSLSQGEAVPERQPVLSERNHFGLHCLSGEEVDQTLPGQRFLLFRARQLLGVPG